MHKRRGVDINGKNKKRGHKKYLANKKKQRKKTELHPVHEVFFDLIEPPEGQGNGSIKFNWSILILFIPFSMYFLEFIQSDFIPYILLVLSIIVAALHIAFIFVLYRDLGSLINPQNLIFNSLIVFALSVVYLGIAFYYIWVIDQDSYAGGDTVLTVFDMIYYSFVTVATLGYGDILPNSKLTKSLTIFQILYGIWFLITVIPVLVADQTERLKKYRIEHKKLMELVKEGKKLE